MVNKRFLVWDKIAFEQLNEEFSTLTKNSHLIFAKKVKNKILKSINELIENPEIYEQDRFKVDNDGSYRAFEKLKYRIAYRITATQIRILRVRHSSREPKKH